MSLVSMPFVGTTADTILHVVASVVLIGSIATVALAFWKFHELPIHKAHSRQHQQTALITALTWIGFLWHWVWVLAVIIAFVDLDVTLRRIRDIWYSDKPATTETKTQSAQVISEKVKTEQEPEHA